MSKLAFTYDSQIKDYLFYSFNYSGSLPGMTFGDVLEDLVPVGSAVVGLLGQPRHRVHVLVLMEDNVLGLE